MNTRKQRARNLVRMLTEGPSFGIGFPFKDTVSVEEANTEASNAFRLWSTSWIIPELLELIPELRKKGKGPARC